MPIRNRAKWLVLDARSGQSGHQEENILPAAGGFRGERPKPPTGLLLSGRPGYIDITWQPVLENESGKPLEAFARYRVYYRWGSGNIPDIDPRDQGTYDDVVVVDNTWVSFAARAGENSQLKVAITCIDRWGRESAPSSQQQGTTVFRKTASVLDWGIITSYGDDIEKTIVRTWPNVTVPDGYRYLITVLPFQGYTEAGAHNDSDLFGVCFTYLYGLFWCEGQLNESFPHLLPGTYTDVKLVVFHSQARDSYATCWDASGQSIIPQYTFDYTFRGLMRLGGHLVEKEIPPPFPEYKDQWVFVPVLWMVWSVPL